MMISVIDLLIGFFFSLCGDINICILEFVVIGIMGIINIMEMVKIILVRSVIKG